MHRCGSTNAEPGAKRSDRVRINCHKQAKPSARPLSVFNVDPVAPLRFAPVLLCGRCDSPVLHLLTQDLWIQVTFCAKYRQALLKVTFCANQ